MKLSLNKKDIIEYSIISIFILLAIGFNFFLAQSIKKGIILNVLLLVLVITDNLLRKYFDKKRMYWTKLLFVTPFFIVMYVYFMRKITHSDFSYFIPFGAYFGGNSKEIKERFRKLNKIRKLGIIFFFIGIFILILFLS